VKGKDVVKGKKVAKKVKSEKKEKKPEEPKPCTCATAKPIDNLEKATKSLGIATAQLDCGSEFENALF